MAHTSQNVFAKNLLILLKETFEGPGGSVYLDALGYSRRSAR